MSKKDSKIANIMNDIKGRTNKIMKMEREIEKLKRTIHEDECRLYQLCEHTEWVRCEDCSFDDLCKFYCKKCSLWKNKNFYQ